LSNIVDHARAHVHAQTGRGKEWERWKLTVRVDPVRGRNAVARATGGATTVLEKEHSEHAAAAGAACELNRDRLFEAGDTQKTIKNSGGKERGNPDAGLAPRRGEVAHCTQSVPPQGGCVRGRQDVLGGHGARARSLPASTERARTRYLVSKPKIAGENRQALSDTRLRQKHLHPHPLPRTRTLTRAERRPRPPRCEPPAGYRRREGGRS